jgi:hypothetical protein
MGMGVDWRKFLKIRAEGTDPRVNKPPPPDLLQQLIAAGRWGHPKHDELRAAAPFIADPLIFLTDYEQMLWESMGWVNEDDAELAFCHEYRGSRCAARDLPWVDVEKHLIILCNERIGDDVAIALDYRTSLFDPRVIGTEYGIINRKGLILWREISPCFSDFCEMLNF